MASVGLIHIHESKYAPPSTVIKGLAVAGSAIGWLGDLGSSEGDQEATKQEG